jgi:hypothetical protein
MGQIEIVGQQPMAKQKDFFCPTCGTARPPFSFEMNGGDLGMMGMVQYITVFCGAKLHASAPCHQKPVREWCDNPSKFADGKAPDDVHTCYPSDDAKSRECGCILTVAVVLWQPPQDPVMFKALQEALRKGPQRSS